MSALPKLDQRISYSGEHLNIPFELVHWGKDRASSPPLNNGRGCWNYYIFIHERRISNFDTFWLEPKVTEFSPGGTKYLHFDYSSSPLASAYWHGGVTFWESNNALLPGQRYLKIGCDFSHLFDAERDYDYTLTEVHAECLRTINEIHPLLQFKA